MKKGKSRALIQTLITVGIIAVLSLVVSKMLDQEINPEMAMNVNVSEIGQAVLDVLVDAISSLINPERRSLY